MRVLAVSQGSDEWLQVRQSHSTASEAPAALGQSKYQNRNDLLKQKHTGFTEDVGYAKQALFDRGHEAESAARPLAEEIIGSALYPITATLTVDGIDLLASLDGISMDEEVIWEHKLYSERLAADVRSGNLDPHYTIQLDQQLLVTGAKKCLFMTSDGTVENMAYCWYESSKAKFDSLISGWTQFAADLAAYKPKAIAEPPKPVTIERLPALAVLIKGEVVSSNLPAFRDAATQFISGIKTDLATDQDFADADANVKFCEKAEKDLEQAKQAVTSQVSSIDDLIRTVDFIKDQLRAKRLELSKLVDRRKMEIKIKIVSDANAAFTEHVTALEAEITPIRLANVTMPDFIGSAKNKRTLAGLNDAVDGELAKAKINADSVAKEMRAKLAWYSANTTTFAYLFNDLNQIIQKPMEDFRLTVTTRIDAHKVSEAAREERIKTEAVAAAAQAIQVAQSPTLATVVSINPTTITTSTTSAIPRTSKVRAELNSMLDRLTDDQLNRIVNFVKSRYPQGMAA